MRINATGLRAVDLIRPRRACPGGGKIDGYKNAARCPFRPVCGGRPARRAGRPPQTGRKHDGMTTLAINLSLHRGKRGGGETANYD